MSNLEMKTKRRVLVILGFTLPFWILVACICAVPVQAQETSEPELKVEPVTQANYPNVLIDVSSRFVSAGISVPLNSCGDWSATPTWRRSEVLLSSRTSTPPTLTVPAVAS